MLLSFDHGRRRHDGGGFGAMGVAATPATCANPLKLQPLLPLRQKNDK